jgi:hypothetical protein
MVVVVVRLSAVLNRGQCKHKRRKWSLMVVRGKVRMECPIADHK